MNNEFKAWDNIVLHSLPSALLCCAKTRPPLGHDKACGTENFFPQTSHLVGRLKGTIPYQIWRLSWNSSLENYVPLRHWGIAVCHTPFSVARWRRFSPAPSARSFSLVSAAFYKNSICFCPSALALRTNPL